MADFLGASLAGTAGRDCEGLTVELDDDVDDSRTGGRPRRVESFLSPELVDTGGLLRVGLGCRDRGVLDVAGASMLDEYEDAELGVGTWLKGESVYLVDGVADGA